MPSSALCFEDFGVVGLEGGAFTGVSFAGEALAKEIFGEDTFTGVSRAAESFTGVAFDEDAFAGDSFDEETFSRLSFSGDTFEEDFGAEIA